MRRSRALGVAAIVCCLVCLLGGCEERHGFLKIGSNALFGNNKITSIYLLERRGGFSCDRGGD